jgi:hypothetical protein
VRFHRVVCTCERHNEQISQTACNRGKCSALVQRSILNGLQRRRALLGGLPVEQLVHHDGHYEWHHGTCTRINHTAATSTIFCMYAMPRVPIFNPRVVQVVRARRTKCRVGLLAHTVRHLARTRLLREWRWRSWLGRGDRWLDGHWLALLGLAD